MPAVIMNLLSYLFTKFFESLSNLMPSFIACRATVKKLSLQLVHNIGTTSYSLACSHNFLLANSFLLLEIGPRGLASRSLRVGSISTQFRGRALTVFFEVNKVCGKVSNLEKGTLTIKWNNYTSIHTAQQQRNLPERKSQDKSIKFHEFQQKTSETCRNLKHPKDLQRH